MSEHSLGHGGSPPLHPDPTSRSARSGCWLMVNPSRFSPAGRAPELGLAGGGAPGGGHPAPTLPLPQALAAHGGRILPGDEIVQVNEQVVVSQGGRGLEGGAAVKPWTGSCRAGTMWGDMGGTWRDAGPAAGRIWGDTGKIWGDMGAAAGRI